MSIVGLDTNNSETGRKYNNNIMITKILVFKSILYCNTLRENLCFCKSLGELINSKQTKLIKQKIQLLTIAIKVA